MVVPRAARAFLPTTESPADGRKRPPLLWLTLGMASLGVSWVGLLRVCNSHGCGGSYAPGSAASHQLAY